MLIIPHEYYIYTYSMDAVLYWVNVAGSKLTLSMTYVTFIYAHQPPLIL